VIYTVSGANGSRSAAALYDAYGGNKGAAQSSTICPWGYDGYYQDSSTGLYYLQNRYYDPGTGHFTQQDPARDGTNWYGYCSGDPINRSDPTGLSDVIIPVKSYYVHMGWASYRGYSYSVHYVHDVIYDCKIPEGMLYNDPGLVDDLMEGYLWPEDCGCAYTIASDKIVLTGYQFGSQFFSDINFLHRAIDEVVAAQIAKMQAAATKMKIPKNVQEKNEQMIETLTPETQIKARAFLTAAYNAGYPIFITWANRTEDQEKAMNDYLKSIGQKPTVGTSHNGGKAFDVQFWDKAYAGAWPGDPVTFWEKISSFGKLVPSSSKKWGDLAKIANGIGLSWGVNLPGYGYDYDHFELR